MKLNNIIRGLVAAVALSSVSPSLQAEQMTDAQRACVQNVLKKSVADGHDKAKKELAPDSPEAKALFLGLEARFSKKAPYRPASVTFASVKKALTNRPDLLCSLNWMEKTGGQPDVIDFYGDVLNGFVYLFADVSKESPESRRCLTYDEAKAIADKMGLKMMDGTTYRILQTHIHLDTETWSWLLTKTDGRGEGLLGHRLPNGNVGMGFEWASSHRNQTLGFRGLLEVPKTSE